MAKMHGVDRVLKVNGKLKNRHTLQRGALAVAEEHKNDTAPYPPAPPRSQYFRTGDLGRGWVVKESMNLGAILGNKMPYAPKVQGTKQEPMFARIGWTRIDRSFDKNKRKYARIFVIVLKRGL